MNKFFWKSLSPTQPIPLSTEELLAKLKLLSPEKQAEFFRDCAEITCWRQLPKIKKVVKALFSNSPLSPKIPLHPNPSSSPFTKGGLRGILGGLETRGISQTEALRAIHIAHLFYYWAKPVQAKKLLELAGSCKNLDRKEKGLIAWIKAKIASGEHKLTEAYRSFRLAERLVTEKYPVDRGRVCGSLGLFYRQIGEPEKARFWIQQGLKSMRGKQERHSIAMLYGNLGHLNRELGKYVEALACFIKDKKIGKQVGDVYGEILNCIRIAEIYRLLGKDQKAKESYQDAIRIEKIHPEHQAIALAKLGLAQIYIREEKFSRAKELIQSAQEQIRNVSRLRYKVFYKITLARLIQHSEKNLSKAYAILKETEKIAGRTDDVFVKVKLLHELAQMEMLLGLKHLSRKHGIESLHLAEKAGLHESIMVSEKFLAKNFIVDFTTERLGRYIGHEKVKSILSTRQVQAIGSKKVTRTILSGDLRGFTRMSEKFPPQKVTKILNRYFDSVAGAVERMGGNIDKFMGDGFLAVFGGSVAKIEKALPAARIIQRETQDMNLMLQPELDGYKLSVGLGLNRGKVIEGEVGSSRRFDYTVIGDAVNVSWRLQELAGPGEILLTQDTLLPIQNSVSSQLGIVPLGKRRLLGRAKPVPIYRLDPMIPKEVGG